MLEMIKNSCESFPDRNAFCINDIFYSYKQFAEAVSKIRLALENDCKDEKIIAIVSYESPDLLTYASIYACWFCGKGFVPVNPDNPIDRNISMLNQTEIKTILSSVVNDSVKNISERLNEKIICTANLADTKINLSIPDVDREEIAYILFTSGSSGIPKGVPITRNNVASLLDAFFSLNYKLDENDKFLQMFELTFDFSVFCYTAPLCKGACIYTVASGGVKYANVYMALENYEITFACMVPSILSYLRPYFEDIKLEKLNYSLFCGEALLTKVAGEWANCIPNGKIINAYGPTEATVFCLIYDFDPAKKENEYNGIVSIGRPMKNIDAVVVDENLKPVSNGTLGELCLSGAQLTKGYWKNPGRNKEMFFNYAPNENDKTYYRTGDLALISDTNIFMFGGRLDSQIKIQGFRIELGEIEHFTREFTKLTNVAAVSMKNKNDIVQIHLFVEDYKGGTSEIEDYLKTKIPSYMIPSTIKSIPSFPLNSNGKIDRIKLAGFIA